MAEFFHMLIDRIGTDPYKDAKCFKRGYVVMVVDDGHDWGSGELMATHGVIRKAPGVPRMLLEPLLANEDDGEDFYNPNSVALLRMTSLDPDLLPAGDLTYLQIMAARVFNPSAPDPEL